MKLRSFPLLAALAAISLAGCAGPSQPGETGASEPTTSYDQWTPTTRVSKVELSDQDRENARKTWLESNRATLGVPESQPLPTLSRWVSGGEGLQPAADCIREAGYEVSEAPGVWGLDLGAAMASPSAAIQIWQCMGMYPSETILIPSGSEQLGVKYEYYTEFLVPCLEDQGVEFIADPPSKDVWIAQMQDLGSTSEEIWLPDTPLSWTPDSQAKFSGREELSSLFEACPVLPPIKYLTGW